MKKIIAVAAAAALALTLAGCVGVRDTSSPEPAQPSAPGPDTVTPPTFAEAPEPDPAPENMPFGNAVTYEDGMSISVSTPSPYTPSEYAAGNDYPTNLSFTITVTNGTGANVDAYAYVQVTSGGTSGSQIFDLNTSYPTGVILPGQSLSWVENWSVADPNAIVLSVAPGFEYTDAIFTNVAG